MHYETDTALQKSRMTFMKGEELKIEKTLFQKLLKAHRFIEEHFLDTPANDTIANYCGLSIFHFIRTYKMVFKETPLHTVTRFKMMMACSMLSRSSLDVYEIAAVLKYPDTFTFSKAFKKHFELPPSKYRITQGKTPAASGITGSTIP